MRGRGSFGGPAPDITLAIEDEAPPEYRPREEVATHSTYDPARAKKSRREKDPGFEFVIISANLHGLLPRIAQVSQWKADALLLQETWLTELGQIKAKTEMADAAWDSNQKWSKVQVRKLLRRPTPPEEG